MMEKQQTKETAYELSKKLKNVVIVLAILGAFLTIGAVFLRLCVPHLFETVEVYTTADGGGVDYIPNQELAQSLMGFSVFTVIVAGLCYKILWHFWHVCTEIGRDNSFSPENETSFHRMANTAFMISGIYALKLAFYGGRTFFITHEILTTIVMCVLIVVFMILFLLFGVICEALSKLIKNAYEIKAENDLTI